MKPHTSDECNHSEEVSQSVALLMITAADSFDPHTYQHLLCVASRIACPGMMLPLISEIAAERLTDFGASCEVGALHFVYLPDDQAWTFRIIDDHVERERAVAEQLGVELPTDPITAWQLMGRTILAATQQDAATLSALWSVDGLNTLSMTSLLGMVTSMLGHPTPTGA